MTPEQFVYWLQGFMETANPKKIDEKQTIIIKDHLKLVFKKETPSRENFKLEDFTNYEMPRSFPPQDFPPGTIIC